MATIKKYIEDITLSEFHAECSKHDNDCDGGDCPFDEYCDLALGHDIVDLTSIDPIVLPG